ncbi:sensor domain-containing protein [Streptomyces sp. DSM 41527]|uniref:histidine kinase n=1 Tax=Streptomyces mooreae TaxID=3075523 RepID=A0ABU2TIC4_9ACTN|nr:sensor domain-containing protein [Streptomyces sp. DSM 41527]MDT0460649.1 sensor domain-containing protein [Streptomyces sp. DSM 41527]
MSSSPTWRALTRSPANFLTSAAPWRALGYLASAALVGLLSLVVLGGVVVCGLLLSVVGVGLVLLAGSVLLGIPLAALERRRLRLLEGPHTERPASPHEAVARPGLWPWLTTRLREPATWREFSYALVFAVPLSFVNLALLTLTGLLVALVVAPVQVAVASAQPEALVLTGIGIAGLPVAAYVLGAAAAAQSWFVRLMLAPKEGEQADRVMELTRSRARMADAFEAERRRIERDLHDGAQQHLVALVMTLGLAELELGAADPAAGKGGELVSRARREAKHALDELRDLIRGIHPQVLTDHGIAAAVSEVAVRCRVPVAVDVELAGRLPAQIEATAYFFVSEALTNVVKHSGAATATVHGRLAAGRLSVTVTDDGTGGAELRDGGGLQGLADRVAVVDGRLTLSSPLGGPTALSLEIPCRHRHSVSS